MDKMKLAHDWYMKNCSRGKSYVSLEVEWAWQYADEMQKQFEKRKEIEVDVDVSSSNWQPDWSQVSSKMQYFSVDEDGRGYFYTTLPTKDKCVWFNRYNGNLWATRGSTCAECWSHNYTGDWKDSLRQRPNNE